MNYTAFEATLQSLATEQSLLRMTSDEVVKVLKVEALGGL